MPGRARQRARGPTSDATKPEWEAMGSRLAAIRGARPQPAMAELLGVSTTTYGRLERGVREIGADVLQALAGLGWNPAFVVTGRGGERLSETTSMREPASGYGGADLSEEHLAIALELADRAIGQAWIPRPRFARLLRVLYRALGEGRPMAEIERLATESVQALVHGGASKSNEAAD